MISSLDRNEKGYFKKYAIRNSPEKSNIHVKLFDAIEKQTSREGATYNEEKILQEIPRIKPGQLSNIKAYLFELLLKSLDNYSANKSVEDHIKRKIAMPGY